MSERVTHCPFLNRADSRCANHFSLDKLGSAFDHCFGEYKACPTYAEMLDERRHRPDAATLGSSAHANFHSPVVYATMTRSNRSEPVHANVSYVQVRVRREHATIA